MKALFTHNVDYNCKPFGAFIIPHYVNIDLRGRRYVTVSVNFPLSIYE